MDDKTVPERATMRVTCGDIAADLQHLASAFEKVADLELEVNPYVTFGIQPGGTDEQIKSRTDVIGNALFGKPGEPKDMGGNTWHYKVRGHVGAIEIDVYDRITGPEAAEREAEIERLRARVAELEEDLDRAHAGALDEDNQRAKANVIAGLRSGEFARVANPNLARFLAHREDKARTERTEAGR